MILHIGDFMKNHMAYLADNIGAARGTLPDEATRQKMAAMVDG